MTAITIDALVVTAMDAEPHPCLVASDHRPVEAALRLPLPPGEDP